MNAEKKTKKILVVDDDPVVIRLMERVLITNGFEVVVADEAPRGLEIAMKGGPHLIILDVMMPIINGYNICRLLKSEEGHKHIPIVLLTSRATEEDRRIGEEVGADAYIVKPFDTEDLLTKVKELLKLI
jgi:two-component system cell cycle response regulator